MPTHAETPELANEIWIGKKISYTMQHLAWQEISRFCQILKMGGGGWGCLSAWFSQDVIAIHTPNTFVRRVHVKTKRKKGAIILQKFLGRRCLHGSVSCEYLSSAHASEIEFRWWLCVLAHRKPVIDQWRRKERISLSFLPRGTHLTGQLLGRCVVGRSPLSTSWRQRKTGWAQKPHELELFQSKR